jgi:hypothetical protein
MSERNSIYVTIKCGNCNNTALSELNLCVDFDQDNNNYSLQQNLSCPDGWGLSKFDYLLCPGCKK